MERNFKFSKKMILKKKICLEPSSGRGNSTIYSSHCKNDGPHSFTAAFHFPYPKDRPCMHSQMHSHQGKAPVRTEQMDPIRKNRVSSGGKHTSKDIS